MEFNAIFTGSKGGRKLLRVSRLKSDTAHQAFRFDKQRKMAEIITHGQSVVAFAFCHLLGFKLMPRFKNIGSQKLYRPEAGMNEEYPYLQEVLSRPINWDLIRQQYEQIIKYATVRLGTASAEAILKRFTRDDSLFVVVLQSSW